jgi:importin-7
VNFRAIASALDDPEFPVRVQAALALTEMVIQYKSGRYPFLVSSPLLAPLHKHDLETDVDIVQWKPPSHHKSGKSSKVRLCSNLLSFCVAIYRRADLLKLTDETDLDILNRSMEVMVEAFQTELLPVAAQLTARLVGSPCLVSVCWYRSFEPQCDSYMRLARESLAQEEAEAQNGGVNELDLVMGDTDDDKTFSAMGVAKTIGTVCFFFAFSYAMYRADMLTGCLFDRQLPRDFGAGAGGYTPYDLVYAWA